MSDGCDIGDTQGLQTELERWSRAYRKPSEPNGYAEAVAFVRGFATAAHQDQRDLAGDPYIQHLARVTELVTHGSPWILDAPVAWLHDVLEDTWWGSHVRLFAESVTGATDPLVVPDVNMLTRDHSEPYLGYIHRVVEYGSPRALRVKLADVCDHLREGHTANVSDSMIRRYAHAFDILVGAADKNRVQPGAHLKATVDATATRIERFRTGTPI